MQKKLLIAAIFLGSFISFALEPMIGRALLPVFGGTPMVWVTCLGAFQLLMVGGYYYGARLQASGVRRPTLGTKHHVALLALVGAWCIALSRFSAPVIAAVSSLTGIGPVDVMIAVLALIGVAFVLLSANATIVQNLSGGDYRLYSVSNLGSLLGLFAYPLLVEPFVGLSTQWSMLGGGILAYAAILFVAFRNTFGASTVPSAADASDDAKHSAPDTKRQAPSTILYFLIPAASCALLNSVTTHLTLDVIPLPLLWAALLGLFLLSYIVGFSGKGKSTVWIVPAALAILVSGWVHPSGEGNNIAGYLPISASLLFFTCAFLHSWLYEIRPRSDALGRYYLLNVAGGAAGGLATSVVGPLVFSSVLEYPIMLVVSASAVVAWLWMRRRQVGVTLPWIAAGVFAVGFVCAAIKAEFNEGTNRGKCRVVLKERGFFGTITVHETDSSSSDGQAIKINDFYHGNTLHGIQVMRKEMSRMPTAYYTPYGCGYSIWGHPNYSGKRPMRVQLVGLGTGVLFAYSRPGDYYHAYEISPEALAIAKNPKYFTFVSESQSKNEIILDDARKGLERELATGTEPYDVIVVDAFTGDSVPYHLSTKEAIELYLKLLKDDGVLCIHISNKHLDLRPYIKRIGIDFGMEPIVIMCAEDKARLGFATEVAFFTRHPEKLRALPIGKGLAQLENLSSVKPMPHMPTDEKGSFLGLLHFSE